MSTTFAGYLTLIGVLILAVVVSVALIDRLRAWNQRRSRKLITFRVTYTDGNLEQIKAVDVRWEGAWIAFEDEAGIYFRILAANGIAEVEPLIQ